jgi:hypothetical protein
VETLDQVAARLSDHERLETWNPNSGENSEFDWWAAIRKARVKNIAHFNELVGQFPPPDYREVELLALKTEFVLDSGDLNSTRDFAERAIKRARDGSWHRWVDGAQKRTAFSVLKRIDRTEGVARAREQFGTDLARIMRER